MGALAVTLPSCGRSEWVELFDGQSLEGWTPSENKDSWQVTDGQITTAGPRSHLFYTGSVQDASFRNFELEVEAQAGQASNSGVYIHTAFQETGWPAKGFEIQINNSTATGSGERKRTGSIYGVRNTYKQFVGSDEWFTLNIAVRGKNIQISLNQMPLINYTEPEPPILADGSQFKRVLDRGTFALQCHDPGTKVRFRRIRVRPLSDSLPTPGPAPQAANDLDRATLNIADGNIPMVDYHIHLKSGLTLEQAVARSISGGIQYGIAANCGQDNPVQDDAALRAYVEQLRGQPIFIAMQAEGREWLDMFLRQRGCPVRLCFHRLHDMDRQPRPPHAAVDA